MQRREYAVVFYYVVVAASFLGGELHEDPKTLLRPLLSLLRALLVPDALQQWQQAIVTGVLLNLLQNWATASHQVVVCLAMWTVAQV